jgi:hypothetical protein
MIGEQRVIQMKTHFMSKGLVPLERLFNANDVPLNPSMNPRLSEVNGCNLGIEENPKLVNISKTLSPKEK